MPTIAALIDNGFSAFDAVRVVSVVSVVNGLVYLPTERESKAAVVL